MPEGSPVETGNFIRSLMARGQAARVLMEDRTSGHGYLFRKGPLPDTTSLPASANLVVLLLEHHWATGFWSAMHHTSAYPVNDVWMGHEGLQAAGLPVGTP